MVAMMAGIQCCSPSFGSFSTVFNAFLSCETEKRMYRSTGIKACEHLDLEFKNLHHYDADPTLFETIEFKRKELAQEVVTQKPRRSLG